LRARCGATAGGGAAKTRTPAVEAGVRNIQTMKR
jgi:hypothetical protein